MNNYFYNTLLSATGAESFFEIEVIQSLWSGYGSIVRYGLVGATRKRVVVKHVKLPSGGAHPRGWGSDRSHQRKITSYEVETEWYQKWSAQCGAGCRVPKCLAVESVDDEVFMVLEDLDESGFGERRSSVGWREIDACLSWLAHFHATYIQSEPIKLWRIGTYWHLDTRPDELEVLTDMALKKNAAAIDAKLDAAQFKTLVHGDAKLANFCFSSDGSQVAAVDFQYVGGGCGMKDVAYFVGSCMGEDECERAEEKILTTYFTALKKALIHRKSAVDVGALEREWREMYPVAWADFHRFLKGWSPGHWKINSYSERVTSAVVSKIVSGQ